MHDSILTYAKSRYLWIALVLIGVSLIAYLAYDPGGPQNGGTWLGYTLGTIGALLIVWLMLFGIRKRSYVHDHRHAARLAVGAHLSRHHADTRCAAARRFPFRTGTCTR